MPKKTCSYFFLISCVLATGAGAQNHVAESLPNELREEIVKHYPLVSILSYSQVCSSSPNGAQQIGVILKLGGHRNASLEAIVGVYDGKEWSLTNVAKSVNYPLGAVHNFLSDYNEKNLPEIRCATPNHDPDISLGANGLYALKHKDVRQKLAKHLCFTIDVTYNSWVCYWTPPQTKEAKVSFVQMNAD